MKWTSIGRLRNGAIFETRDGIRAVKSEYHYPNGGCECVLLSSGEYAHFCQDDSIERFEQGRRHNATHVHEILLPKGIT